MDQNEGTRLSGREIAHGLQGFFKGAPCTPNLSVRICGRDAVYEATAILERDGSFEDIILRGPSAKYDPQKLNPNYYKLTVINRR